MPKGPVDDLAFNLMRNLHAVIANYVFTFLLTMSFLFQVHIMPSYGQTNALSKWTLALQSFTFLLLAISWPFRLILPPNMWEHGLKPAVLMEWYPWVGWACVNSAIMAIGQGVLLFISSRGGVGGSIGLVGEDEILLVRAWK